MPLEQQNMTKMPAWWYFNCISIPSRYPEKDRGFEAKVHKALYQLRILCLLFRVMAAAAISIHYVTVYRYKTYYIEDYYYMINEDALPYHMMKAPFGVKEVRCYWTRTTELLRGVRIPLHGRTEKGTRT